MKYERITERDEYSNADIIDVDMVALCSHLAFADMNRVTEALNRLAELEDKIEDGEFIEQTSEEYSTVRKQTVKEFAEKLRDKEFSAKIGEEWFAVVKSRDIVELVKEVCGE